MSPSRCWIMLWRRSVVTATTLLLCCYSIEYSGARKDLNQDVVEFWASSLGDQLKNRCQEASGIEDLQQEYVRTRANRRIKSTDASELVLDTSKRIENFLQTRYNAAWEIKRNAEKLFAKYVAVNYTCNNFTYYNSKQIKIYKDNPEAVRPPETIDENSTYSYQGPNLTYYLPLYEEWRKYYKVPVSLNASAIHVPTNIYDCAPPLLGNISWSEGLDSTFSKNYPSVPSGWQYFASSAGFMRFYPAANWSYDGMDMYDSRLTEWYTGAASTPKSVIILLDNSGSMTGLRIEIAKTTAIKIMESLHENDYFNLITFNNDTLFVDCQCQYSNGTLIQATKKNIRRVSEALDDINITEIANFSRAFRLAFDVLKQADESQLTGGQSNNAIMVVTDGAPEGYADVFKEYNWDNVSRPDGTYRMNKWARVFSYLIGQEVTLANKAQVEWMACANKGYFYHIGTMADVHDYVQDYLRVMARPLAVYNKAHYMWTGIHVNVPLLNDNSGYNPHTRTDDWIRAPSSETEPTLTISVAMPVYDLRPDERNNGNLLGVAGVDVALDEVINLIPRAQLGVNGYFFIINNNGFVLSHPYLTPWMGPCDNSTVCEIARESHPHLKENKPKPDYKNVDLLHLEQEEDPSSGTIARLREAMIRGEVGNIGAKVKKFYSKEFTRVYIQSQTYYYAPIAKTPYSIAFVRVEPSGGKVVVYADQPEDYQKSFDWCPMVVANWNYCQWSKEELDKLTLEQKIETALASGDCDIDLAKAVVYDVVVTRVMPAVWGAAQNIMEECNGSSQCELKRNVKRQQKTLSFDMVVIGTRSGVTRFQELNREGDTSTVVRLSDSAYCVRKQAPADFLTPSIDADYFKRAATARKGIWNFAAKVNEAFVDYENFTHISVTSSKGVYIQDDGETLLASVLGLNIQYNSLHTMFDLTTSFCSSSIDCSYTNCTNPAVDCFLIDENGYIVVAKDVNLVGKFFGDVDYQILLDMKDQGMFKEIPVTDYQALCTICNYGDDTSSASSLLNPFRYIFKILWWNITKAALFFMEFSLYDWWHCVYYATAEVVAFKVNSTQAEAYEYLPVDKHTVQYMVGPENVLVRSAFNSLQVCVNCKVYVNSTIENLDLDLNISTSTENTLSYMAREVPNTNLYLLVLEGDCRCNGQQEEYCVLKQELLSGCTAEAMNSSRRPPIPHGRLTPPASEPANVSHIEAYNTKRSKNQPPLEEELQTCGGSSSVTASPVTLVILQVIAYWTHR